MAKRKKIYLIELLFHIFEVSRLKEIVFTIDDILVNTLTLLPVALDFFTMMGRFKGFACLHV